MKLQILRPEQEPIEGYKTVTISDAHLNLSELSDNECDTILAPEIMDSFPADKSSEVLSGIAAKLRQGGELVVGGTDIRIFAKMVSNGALLELPASEIVGKSTSMTTVKSVTSILSSLGLDIASTTIEGIHYEVKATRGR